ncbi:MAG TPA: TonB family protein [Vicinamibacteria bacterium]|nr:TonB family protein [Vicinamibacteria bacterium]
MSIGAPSILRARGPLELRRDEDLTASPKGHREARSLLAAPPGDPGTPEPRDAARQRADEAAAREGLSFRAGAGRVAPQGEEHAERSIASSLHELDRRLRLGGGPPGVESGLGRQMGPLFFDPQGADFTAWINHFKNEVYRNWVVPQSALFGYAKGQVSFEFTVERDGRVSALRLIESSATPALDRAAQNSLRSSRLLPLPVDFAPVSLTLQVTFYYNQEPRDA